ncbi:MAG: cell division protein ZapA [Myxococcota bacterium]
MTPWELEDYLRGNVKRTVQIEIAGARYRMSSDADETYLQKLADIVNQRVAALGPKAARAATPAQLLAVVALSLAEDLEVSERRRASLEDKTRQVVGAAIRRIDERLQTDAELAQQIDQP